VKLPNIKAPCKDCPFRKDAPEGWLGEERIINILAASSFTCHKTSRTRLQCAGHMIIKGDENDFVLMAKRLSLETGIKGHDLIFDTKNECIEHHK